MVGLIEQFDGVRTDVTGPTDNQDSHESAPDKFGIKQSNPHSTELSLIAANSKVY